MKVILVILILITSIGLISVNSQSNFTYKMKNGDTVSYEINYFHNFNITSFNINVSNSEVLLENGSIFNITASITSNNTINFSLEIQEKNTTDLNQKFLTNLEFAIPTSTNVKDYTEINDAGYHYYISGDYWHEDHSYSQSSSTLTYNQISQVAYNWKTGWLESYYAKEYEKKSGMIEKDFEFGITRLGSTLTTKTSNLGLDIFTVIGSFLILSTIVITKMKIKKLKK